MERSKWEEGVLISDEEALEMLPLLEELVRLPGWQIYLELVKAARVHARETAMAQGKDQFDYWIGHVAGLAAAEAIPTLVAQLAARAAGRAEANLTPRRRRASLLSEDAGDLGGF